MPCVSAARGQPPTSGGSAESSPARGAPTRVTPSASSSGPKPRRQTRGPDELRPERVVTCRCSTWFGSAQSPSSAYCPAASGTTRRLCFTWSCSTAMCTPAATSAALTPATSSRASTNARSSVFSRSVCSSGVVNEAKSTSR